MIPNHPNNNNKYDLTQDSTSSHQFSSGLYTCPHPHPFKLLLSIQYELLQFNSINYNHHPKLLQYNLTRLPYIFHSPPLSPISHHPSREVFVSCTHIIPHKSFTHITPYSVTISLFSTILEDPHRSTNHRLYLHLVSH